MKTSKFYVKSNYIKNAKKDWIFCEGRLLCHQNITFLHLKSINLNGNSSDNISDSGSNFSGFSTLSQMKQYRSQSNRNTQCLNVLCNLFEFKTCEIKSVIFEFLKKFAIKLVPSGFLSNKKLYLLPDSEDSLTEWCGLLTGYITRTIAFPIVNSVVDDRHSMTLSSTIGVKKINDCIPTANEIYISLDDNDAYETTNQIEYHLVTIEPSEDSVRFNLQGCYLLKLGVDALELLNTSTRELIHTFPYSAIRRFGAKDTMFRLEAGRYCSTGRGSFTFMIKDAVQISEKVKENARQNKLKMSMENVLMTQSTPSLPSTSIQVETKRDSSIHANSIGTLSSSTSALGECNRSPKASDNFSEEFQNDSSSNTVVDDYTLPNSVEIDIVDTAGADTHNHENKTDELLNYGIVIVEDRENIDEETSLPKTQEEERCTEKKNEETLDQSSVNLKPLHTTKLRDHDDIMSVSDSLDQKSENILNKTEEEITNELRPSSPYESSVSTDFSSPVVPSKNSSSYTLSDYKVSNSTFFKYRQVIKNPILIVSSKSNMDSRSNFIPISTDTNSDQVDIQVSKRSPPPLLPKPAFKTLDENHDQTGYREFDQMLKDLQLSLS